MKRRKKLGTFEGVFTPTVLTVLGVIMYLRLGWIVGNAGFLGALVIIVAAHVITLCTTLSMSSILSNIKVGAGGAYSIITQSLGLEAGGAIGIPMYFCQAFAAAFYIIGFTEVWASFFPTHLPALVGFTAWAVLSGLSVMSARASFRIQYLVLAAVFLSIISFMAGPSLSSTGSFFMGDFKEMNIWRTFALFFPAVTGILAGANMSGELKDPRKNIIHGTLAAVLTGFVVYVILAYWLSRQASTEMLLANTAIIFDLSLWKPLTLAGIFGAILSSSLSTLVGAPRILAAMAENRIIPFSKFLVQKTSSGEPRNAVVISSLVTLSVLMIGSLDRVAEILTLFFLTTYGIINLAVFIEQAIGIVSFRPRLSFSILVPVTGFFGCIAAMILINSYFTLITFLVIISIYYYLSRKHLVSPWGDVRGGVFTALAEWAAQKAMTMPYHPRLWKPSVLVPVETPEDFRRISRFIRDLISPSGRMYYLTITKKENEEEEKQNSIDEVLACLKDQGLFAQKIVICGGRFENEFNYIIQSLLSTFLPPNTVLFTISSDPEKQHKFKKVMDEVSGMEIGVMCLYLHPKYSLGQEKRINLWLRDKSPNINLSVLCALQLKRNWSANLHLMRVVDDSGQVKQAQADTKRFKELARLPSSAEENILTGNFYEILNEIPGDLSILGMPESYEQVLKVIETANHSIVFIKDSGLESALA